MVLVCTVKSRRTVRAAPLFVPCFVQTGPCSCLTMVTTITQEVRRDGMNTFLLSSRTVFMFSIQMASTGPSNRIHFRSFGSPT